MNDLNLLHVGQGDLPEDEISEYAEDLNFIGLKETTCI